MFTHAMNQTARSARSGRPAPRFCSTSVAAALPTPNADSSTKRMMRTATV